MNKNSANKGFSVVSVLLVVLGVVVVSVIALSTLVAALSTSSSSYGDGRSIVEVALAEYEEGPHAGGQKYWSAAGFPSRVEWCGCFVGWCAQEVGLVPGESMPSNFPWAASWAAFYNEHKDQGSVHANNGVYEPQPGDIAVNGAIDASWSQHVGIVEKCEDKYVYTIEGNSGDQLSRNIYYLGDTWTYFATPNYPFGLGSIEPNIKSIAQHLRSKGFSKEAVAAILGTWQAESGIDPSSIEGIFDEPYTIGPRKQKAMSNWEAYTLNVLFPAYEGRLSIAKDAYRGRDGKYYPGIGFAGYTGPRVNDLLDYAEEHHYKWYTVEANIGLFEQDLTTNFTYLNTDDFKKETDLATAVTKFVHCYEMPGGIPQAWYLQRYNNAREILKMID